MSDTDETLEGNEQRASGSRVKGALLNVALLIGSVLICLVVLEGVTRVAMPQQLIILRPDIWVGVDTLGWTHRDHVDTRVNTGERDVSFMTDEEGFRVGSKGRLVRSDSVLVIGDSFMAAMQVEFEHSLPGIIEDSLRGPGSEDVAVRNGGVDSWDPWHYGIFARRRLTQHAYGAVLIFIYTGNDIVARKRDYFPPREPAERGRFSVPLSVSPQAWIDGVARPINDLLEERSHLFTLLKARSEALRIRLGLSAADMPRSLRKARADAPEWEVTTDILAEIDSLARETGQPVLFTLIPSEYQVDRVLFDAHVGAFGLDASALDLDQPNRRLREVMEGRGLRVVDVLDDFREAHEAGVRVYGAVDPHLSPEGHAILYQALEAHLQDLLWD
jgi:hypothetical protein